MDEVETKELQEFDKELKDLMEARKVKIDIAIDFPAYKILPEEAKFALYLFHKYGGVLKPKYTKIK